MPTQTDLFGQMWKEYSLSDSRYLTQDSFVTCMEAVTAMFWGPLSFLIAYCITTDHPLRHPMTIIVSLGQLYGDVLYYATCTFSHVVDSISYCRPELFYFYMYYILLNAFWIVIPFGLMTQSVFASVSAFAQVQKAEQMKKGQ
jgi:cholestenol delta-isomerase